MLIDFVFSGREAAVVRDGTPGVVFFSLPPSEKEGQNPDSDPPRINNNEDSSRALPAAVLPLRTDVFRQSTAGGDAVDLSLDAKSAVHIMRRLPLYHQTPFFGDKLQPCRTQQRARTVVALCSGRDTTL